MVRWLSAIALGLLMAASFWLMGLIWFITQMPTPHQLQVTYPTDAIVVLTGGQGRTEKGITLLRDGKAKWLLVSGVHQATDKTEIFSDFRRRNPNDYARIQSRITLGKRALDTHGNALETADWVHRNKFKTLRLVTASYHMPRSLTEFTRELPHITIIPTPVYTDHFVFGDWWQDKDSTKLVISEYHKTIASLVYGWVRG
jgi:uncharacterized SAM-binding protein YcdF (DUF218 family)